MKIVAIIPIKTNSVRVKNKNFRLINKIPLYRYLLDKLKKTNFDEIYVDSDSPEIKKYCKSMGYKFIQRKTYLAKNNANGNDLLNYHSKIVNADIYFQLFITAPLLKIETINKCIEIMKSKKPVIFNRYKRKYFRSQDKKFRITLDSNLVFYQAEKSFDAHSIPQKRSNANILELKYSSQYDDLVSNISSFFPFRMTKSSKYVSGVEKFFDTEF